MNNAKIMRLARLLAGVPEWAPAYYSSKARNRTAQEARRIRKLIRRFKP